MSRVLKSSLIVIMDNTPKKAVIYTGIDYLRAFLSICVVVWHGHGFSETAFVLDQPALSKHTFSAADFINYHILLAAVPAFVLIACFLYAAKDRSMKYLGQRLLYLCGLALFWTVFQTIFLHGFGGLFALPPHSPKEAFVMVLTSGGTLYYFFISLCIMTMITHFANKLSAPANIVLLLMAVAALMLLPFIAIHTNSPNLTIYWSPLNFIAYPFAAVSINRFHSSAPGKQYRWGILKIILIAVGTLIAVAEWKYLLNPIFLCGQKIALPVYARTSVVIASIILLLASLSIRLPSNPVIGFMSRYSMALYCLHMFCFPVIFSFPAVKSAWVGIILMIVLSYLIAIVLRLVIRDKYVLSPNHVIKNV
ncbi:MAG: acyltransferase family protein [Nitrospirae bacterium]|nr:acyltransferase family protein [Nitrospirota bacterium]